MKLEGRRIACPSMGRPWHGDVLIRLFAERRASELAKLESQPPTDEEALCEAGRRKKLVGHRRCKKGWSERQVPTRICGKGDPIYVRHGEDRRLLVDGAGLCSPGLWEPQDRFPPTGVGGKIHEALQFELDQLDASFKVGLVALLSDQASGRAQSDPFPGEGDTALPGLLAAHHGCARHEAKER